MSEEWEFGKPEFLGKFEVLDSSAFKIEPGKTVDFKCFELTGYETKDKLVAMGAYTAEQVDKMLAETRDKLVPLGAEILEDGTYSLETENWRYVYPAWDWIQPISCINKKAFSKLKLK